MCCTGRDFVGATGRVLKTPRNSFTPNTTAHTAGDAMVTAALPFECAIDSGTGYIDEIVVWETADTGGAVKDGLRLFFLAASQGSLVVLDPYVAPDPVTNVLGWVDIAAADFINIDADHAIATVQPGLNVKPLTGSTIYVVPVALEANDYAASATIDIELRIISD